MVEGARRGVLVTRPATEAAATAERVTALGLAPVLAPLLEIRTARIEWSGRIDAVVVTSGNALPAVAGMVGLPLLAVGDATAAKAQAAGFSDVRSGRGDASDLAALVAACLPAGSHLLLPTAEGEGAALAAALQRSGHVVHRATAYAVHPVSTLPTPAAEAIEAGRLHAALFLSARTARVFRQVLPDALRPCLAGVEALAIGEPAGAELGLLPWRRVRVSLVPTLDQVLALL